MDRQKLERALKGASDAIDLLGQYADVLSREQAEILRRGTPPPRPAREEKKPRRDIPVHDLGDD